VSGVPLAIITIPEAIAQLRASNGGDNEDRSEAAAAVLQTASAFQQQASDTRLRISRPLNTNLRKAMATRASPLSASLAVIKERKDAKSGSRKVLIRISTSLWQLPSPDASGICGKPKKVLSHFALFIYQEFSFSTDTSNLSY
jgi:hypothetical protein